MTRNRLNDLGSSLGEHLREQRQSAKLSLRQLSELAGVSNPYLSQIERGLKRPSAEILQQLAKALEVSAESLYVRAGILEDREPAAGHGIDVRVAIAADPVLTDRQRSTLIDVYESFVGGAVDRIPHRPEPSSVEPAEVVEDTTRSGPKRATESKATTSRATTSKATPRPGVPTKAPGVPTKATTGASTAPKARRTSARPASGTVRTSTARAARTTRSTPTTDHR
ncbi:MAG TPA: helix-turn-helix domain-containing protein [Dermatophilaceae bacterium]|nr:helix-turn-helix domain-containing protein [Dermatophilaceae bacterium]